MSFLMGPKRKRKRRPPPERACLACGASTFSTWKWLCDRCFGDLPFARKKAIIDARAERAPHRVFGISRDSAEWLAEQRLKRVEG